MGAFNSGSNYVFQGRKYGVFAQDTQLEKGKKYVYYRCVFIFQPSKKELNYVKFRKSCKVRGAASDSNFKQGVRLP